MTSDYMLVNGLLFKLLWKRKVTDDPSMVLCVPEEYVPQILYHYHDYIMSSHQGIVRTYLTVREKIFSQTCLKGSSSTYDCVICVKP